MLESQRLKQMDQTNEHLGQIEDIAKMLLALGEERLSVERRQLEALDMQNLITWMHYTRATEQGVDRRVERFVRERLQL